MLAHGVPAVTNLVAQQITVLTAGLGRKIEAQQSHGRTLGGVTIQFPSMACMAPSESHRNGPSGDDNGRTYAVGTVASYSHVFLDPHLGLGPIISSTSFAGALPLPVPSTTRVTVPRWGPIRRPSLSPQCLNLLYAIHHYQSTLASIKILRLETMFRPRSRLRPSSPTPRPRLVPPSMRT